MTHDDRRRHPRARIVPAVKVIAKSGRIVECRLEDISAGGARLSGAPMLAVESPVGSVVRLVIPLGGEPVELPVRMVRHISYADRDIEFAVAFLETSEHIQELIGQAVDNALRTSYLKVLPEVRTELAQEGVTDLDRVATEMQKVKDEQVRRHLFHADLFTESGSAPAARVVSAETREAKDCIIWSLNLYLGLNRNEYVRKKVKEAVDLFGTGSGTSAVSGGLSRLHTEIEWRIARMLGKESAVVFPTGYTANLGALSGLPARDDLLLVDREAHASIVDGIRLSGAKWIAFKHNDVDDLRDKLERFRSRHPNVFVVVESAYSMSGDLCPLVEIVQLKNEYGFYLYVDEAHTFGFYGENGRGYCHELGVVDEVDFVMSTFSKATASVGGFVSAKEKYCTFIRASARAYLFQACLTPPDAAAILASLDEIETNPTHAQTLHANNRYMRESLRAAGFDLGTSQSPIIPIYVPDLEKLYGLTSRLHGDGIYSVAVVFPAVERDRGRMRFIVTATHTRDQIERTVQTLTRNARELGIIR